MAILDLPLVEARQLVEATILRYEEPEAEGERGRWVADPDPMTVYPRKLGSSEAYREGRTETTLNYTCYANPPARLDERERLRLPGDGLPDLMVRSVTVDTFWNVVVIECGGDL